MFIIVTNCTTLCHTYPLLHYEHQIKKTSNHNTIKDKVRQHNKT